MTTLTLDCYGTLIDGESGIIDALRPLLARHGVVLSDNEITTAAQEIEEPLCRPPFRSYRAVLAGVVESFGQRFGFAVAGASATSPQGQPIGLLATSAAGSPDAMGCATSRLAGTSSSRR